MKHFLVILGLTALVWLGVSMSEERTYPLRVQVVMTGYDTIRYAVVEADTALDVQVKMSGFDAFLHSIAGNPTLEIPIENAFWKIYQQTDRPPLIPQKMLMRIK